MPIRLPTNLVNQVVMDYESIVTALDPRNNTGYQTPNTFLVKHFEFLLKTIYTRENILANPWLMHLNYDPAQYSPTTAERFKKLLSLWPDEYLYLWYYVTMVQTGNQRWAISGAKYYENESSGQKMYYEVTNWEASGDYESEGTHPDCGKTRLTTALEIVHRKISTAWLSATNKIYATANWTPTTPVRIIYWYYIGMKYASIEGGHYTVQQVNDYLQNSPEASLSFGFDPRSGSHRFIIKNRVTSNNRRALYQVLNYNTNVLDILDFPIILDGEHNPLLFGVELELSTDYSCQKLVDAAEVPFFAIKSDSSVTGSKQYMYELVTVPMSFKAHRRQWAKLFSGLDYAKFDTSMKTNNGMHVHVEKSRFASKSHIRNFCWFFNNPANRDFIMALSERDEQSFMKYSKNFDIPLGWQKGRTLHNAAELAASIRGATNIHKRGVTIEVRLFKGIVSLANIIKNLESVDAIFHYTMNVALQDMNLKGFMKWLDTTPYNKYPIFKKFINDLDMATMAMTSEIEDIIFLEKDPMRIVTILNMRSIPLRPDHCNYLNSVRKRKLFSYNDVTRRIEVIPQRNPLSSMDRDLQTRYRGR